MKIHKIYLQTSGTHASLMSSMVVTDGEFAVFSISVL